MVLKCYYYYGCATTVGLEPLLLLANTDTEMVGHDKPTTKEQHLSWLTDMQETLNSPLILPPLLLSGAAMVPAAQNKGDRCRAKSLGWDKQPIQYCGRIFVRQRKRLAGSSTSTKSVTIRMILRYLLLVTVCITTTTVE